MIIDTMYLFPLIGMDFKNDLLRAICEDKVGNRINIDDLKINLISLFELQAKASKMNIPVEYVVKGLTVIVKSFTIIPFYRSDVIELAHKINKIIGDYTDSVIISTGAALKEDIISEDSIILKNKDLIKREFGIDILSFDDIVAE